MNENLELLAIVLIGEALLISRQARQDLLRHFWRIVKEIRDLFKGGAP